jgi:hypothetical protein
VKVAAKTAAKQAGKSGLKTGVKLFARGAAEAFKSNIDNIIGKCSAGKVCVFACFPAGTSVHTETGVKNIENVQIGEKVWSYNEQTGETALKEVLQTIEHDADVTLKLRIGDEEIETTAEHPFYTQDGWKNAADLTTSDTLQTKENGQSRISEIEYSYKSKKVFNFAVADWHTFFVGIWGWLVHNICYVQVFLNAYPDLAGKVIVHHSIEQQILKRFPGLFTRAEIDALANLRGIPKNLNSTLHLSQIRKYWNTFYKTFPKPTKQQIIDYAKFIDDKVGHLFNPPL